MKNQNTHWYRANDGGWTANPLFAKQGEVERVGLHECSIQGCEEAHCGSAQEFTAETVYTAEVARLAASVKGTKKLRTLQKRVAHRS